MHVFPPYAVGRSFAGTIVYPPGSHFGPRQQNDIQLLLLHSGSTDVWIDDNDPLTMYPGTVMLLLPGHRERLEFSRSEETWHRWICLSVGELPEGELALLRTLPNTLPLSEEMNQITDAMLDLRFNSTLDNDLLLRSYGLTAVLRYISESRRQQSQMSMHPAVILTKSFIHRHFREEITLKQIADSVNLSGEHLIRLFRQHENCTPIQYLWQHRLRISLDLLEHTGLRVYEIAYQCGFKSAFHFARAVKKLTGLTPSQIRAHE
ncbi:MAG: helix-turn-helix transcriptional regulator [Paenibacillaceae bacterium]|nr:helix-turn-helix transcriptional regulator [Paenibacillaceae bacterium]